MGLSVETCNGEYEMTSYEASGVPIDFTLGVDGLPYAILPNEYEAEDYLKENPELDQQLYCCGGLFNGVRLSETIGM